MRFGREVSSHSSAGRHAATVATALTAPMSATASAAPAPARRGVHREVSPLWIASTTHGASIIGQISEEIVPSEVSTFGAPT